MNGLEKLLTPERIGKVKIVLIGDEQVGKTTLRKHYMGQKQTVTYMATIGADFAKRDTKITLSIDGKNAEYIVEALVWDLAGQDAYKIVRESFYDGASGALVVLDITRPESFDNTSKWLEELWENNGKKYNIPFIILVNKTDLREVDGALSNEEKTEKIEIINNFVQSKTKTDVRIVETSALTGVNVEEAFASLMLDILKDYKI